MLASLLELLVEICRFAFAFFKEDTMHGNGSILEELTGWYTRRKHERKQKKPLVPQPERRIASPQNSERKKWYEA